MNQEEVGEGSQVDEAENFSWSPTNDDRPSDITLVVDTWKFHVHRDVLVKSSGYFTAMLASHTTESRSSVVILKIFNDPDIFRTITEAMYTDNFGLTEENVYDIVAAAVILELCEPLKSIYINYMRNTFINDSFCFDLMYFCVSFGLKDLHSDARKYCLGHFSELKHSIALASITLSELYDYLSDEHLLVDSEMEVVEAIFTWVCSNKYTDIYSPEDYKLREKMKRLIAECVTLKVEEENTYDIIADAVFEDELHVEHFKFRLLTRPRQEGVYMFWANVSTESKRDELLDILKLNVDTGKAEKVGTMTQILKTPQVRVGSAVCHLGPYVYVSGGKDVSGCETESLRQILKFDVSNLHSPGEVIGELIEHRWYHTMVILKSKLFILAGLRTVIPTCDMLSLDIVTGVCEQHGRLPTMECNVAATTDDTSIYYISGTSDTWDIHSYSSETKDWTQIILENPTFYRRLTPKSLYVVKDDKIKFVVASLTINTLQLQLLRPHNETSTLHTLEDDAELEKHLHYGSYAGVFGQVVFSMSHINEYSSLLNQNEIMRNSQSPWIFDPKTNGYHIFPEILGGYPMAGLPSFPSVFRMAYKEFL